MIEFLNVGFYAQLVDGGRRLCSHLGYAPSGALDWLSYDFANALVGNKPREMPISDVSIEITLGDVCMLFHEASVIAITGASAECSLNNAPCEMNRPIFVPSGAKLLVSSIGSEQQGMRVYVAVRGSLAVPRLFSSAANVKREASGGLHGNGLSLLSGDTLHMNAEIDSSKYALLIDAADNVAEQLLQQQVYQVLIHQHSALDPASGLIPGYQWRSFSSIERIKLVSTGFIVTPDADRMGMRLRGEAIKTKHRQLYSQGLCNGAIQCAGDGQLIIMFNDRQTIGGYPVLGAVDAFSRARIAQKRPGATLNFELVDALDIAAKLTMWSEQIKNLSLWVDKQLA